MTKIQELVKESMDIISSFDCKDKYGKVIESGYLFVLKVRERERSGKDVSKSIDIIGNEKWSKLTQIWQEIEKLK